MSAEGLLFKIGEEMLSKVISLLADEISLAWGFKAELKRLETNLKKVNCLIYDASSNNKTHNLSVQEWLNGLNEVAYKADAVLEEYSYETLRRKIESPRKRDKVLSLFSRKENALLIRLQLAHRIRNINISLNECYAEGTRVKLVEKVTTTIASNQRLDHPFIQKSSVVGRDDDILKVVDMLCGSHSDVDDEFSVIAILGIGGQGKTTLAKLVCKHDKVIKHFDNIIWITVSEDFDVLRLLNEMIQSLTEENSQLINIQAIIKKLSRTLQMKRYLLVLDDVWNKDEDIWSCFKSALLEIKAASGSRILTTTRDAEVASTMKTSRVYKLQRLSDDESWTIFKQRAFAQGGAVETAALVDIGKEIVKKCQGLPLAIKVIGSLLYAKESEKDWLLVQNSQLWNLDNNTNRVIQSLKLSYDHLSFPLKHCFSFCSFYPKGKEIVRTQLIECWMALGLVHPPLHSGLEMEDVGDKYFKTLLSCSLLEDEMKDELKATTICKMHDIVHDLALETVQKDYSILNSQALVSSQVNSELHLRVLVLDDHSMRELPDSIKKLKHLRYLDISKTGISVLQKSVTKLYNLQALKIDRLEWVHKDFANLINMRHLYVTHLIIRGSVTDSMSLKEMSRLLTTLTYLEIEECNGSEFQSSLGKVLGNSNRSLRELRIENCNEFVYLPDNLATLEKLELKSCGGLKYIPEQPSKAIWFVEIRDCSDLVSLPDFRYVRTLWLGNVCSSKGVDCFPWTSSSCDVLQEEKKDDIQCLKHLKLWGCAEIKSLPKQLQQLTALTRLTLIGFDGLESLPDWLGNLPSLQYLELGWCDKLKYLPSVEAMRRLTELVELKINYCRLLKSRCMEGTGPEWIKISNIPNIQVDYNTPSRKR